MSRRPADDGEEDGGPRRLPPELVKLAYERAERGEPSFPTAESLAGQGEATSELRQALDDVRRMLDVPSAPPPPRRRRRVPIRLLLLALLAVVAIAAAALIVPREGDGDREGAPATADTSPAIGSLPNTGPGVDAAGTAVGVRAAAGDALDVVEQAVLAAPETDPFPLVLPGLSRLGGELGDLRPEVTGLRVSIDGVPADVRSEGPGRWSVVPPDGGGTRVVATYRLTGAVRSSAPSEPGRAIAVVAPILGGPIAGRDTGGLPLVARGLRPWTVGVSCPDAPAALQLCGSEDDEGWTAAIPGSAAPAVVFQVDAG